MIDTLPHKIVFLGPGCSVATVPVAEAAPYWQAVQVNFTVCGVFIMTTLSLKPVILFSLEVCNLVGLWYIASACNFLLIFGNFVSVSCLTANDLQGSLCHL